MKTLLTAQRSDVGATAVEYALMAALITLAIFIAVGALGLSLEEIFADPELSNALES